MTDEEQQHPIVPVPQEAHGLANLHGTDEPGMVIARATEQANALARVIEDRQLFQQIRDRRHVNVEGWTTLGALVGVFPVVVWSRQTPDFLPRLVESEWRENPDTGRRKKYTTVIQEGRGGWEARVEARTLEGKLVGAAESECRYDESTWSTRDSYALRSMAQTRATSKALRLPLGFIMSLAGFDPSPEEEMPGSRHPTFDLHSYPTGDEAEGRTPLIWSKQVAGHLFGTEAADAWRTAIDLAGQDADVESIDVETAEMVVGLLHQFGEMEGSAEPIAEAEIVGEEPGYG